MNSSNPTLPQRTVFERRFAAAGSYDNPYTQVAAAAVLTEPDTRIVRRIPLFWDGGDAWCFRFSPGRTGEWQWRIESSDSALDRQSGKFDVIRSDHPGSIEPMPRYPHHFQRRDGSPFFFMGDTAWSLLHDVPEKGHDRAATEYYLSTRARQGFNIVHCMALSEVGDGNAGGMPFDDLAAEKINPPYWREADQRIAYANQLGIIVGIVLAWGQKNDQRQWAWNRFASDEARWRYARYIAARYAAYDVYFVVAGEWHAELPRRGELSDAQLRHRFVRIGEELQKADPHHRMIAIHPMTRHGSVREFASTSWMSFGDYQQNYHRMHDRVLLSRHIGRPVVNSEYAYFHRDSSGDGQNDKENSFTPDDVRHSTWDLVMAGGYPIVGFGSTYFGGHRNTGPFDADAPRNRPVEQHLQHLRNLFTSLPWWRLIPASGLLTSDTRRGDDREIPTPGRLKPVPCPPVTTYWALSEPGERYLLYARGVRGELHLALEATGGPYTMAQFNPRTGQSQPLGEQLLEHNFTWKPPDENDWLLLLQRADSQS